MVCIRGTSQGVGIGSLIGLLGFRVGAVSCHTFSGRGSVCRGPKGLGVQECKVSLKLLGIGVLRPAQKAGRCNWP